MTLAARIVGSATATPAHNYPQEIFRLGLCQKLFGDDWAARSDVAKQVHLIERLFASSRVEHRQMAVEVFSYYRMRPPTTGERMVAYEQLSYPLARAALEACLQSVDCPARVISDFIVVSCTGYSAPGLDILLARDLGMPPNVRRLVIGHMGCYGALVGLRSSLANLRAHAGAVVALTTVELSSLHFPPASHRLNFGTLAGSALFGDAAATLLLTVGKDAMGPEIVDLYCAADFATTDQMSWKITDEGFVMGLSPRIPITLRRNVAGVVARLLAPHDVAPAAVTHWLVHPGGPDILDAVAGALDLTEEQMALSWQVLRDHGNCSSSTVLLMLDRLLRSGRTRRGEWCVMMAFGPGLTLETCLLRF